MQRSLNVVRARDVLVRMRTMVVNAVRGLVKPCGQRLPICSTESFAGRCRADLPEELLTIVEPLLKQIELATAQIALCDKRIEEMADGVYRETKALRKIPGVGALTALTYVLTVADKRRFPHSRDVGCYLGCAWAQTKITADITAVREPSFVRHCEYIGQGGQRAHSRNLSESLCLTVNSVGHFLDPLVTQGDLRGR